MTRTLHRSPLRRPWAVWLAVLIAVLGALAPTFTHALMPAIGQASQGLEICTSQGSRWVMAEVTAGFDDSTPLPASTTLPAHCPFCLQSTDRVAPAPHLLPYLFSVQGGQQEVPVWQALFYPQERTFTPPPRGPPGFF